MKEKSISSPTKNINGAMYKHHIFFLHNQKLLILTKFQHQKRKRKRRVKKKQEQNELLL